MPVSCDHATTMGNASTGPAARQASSDAREFTDRPLSARHAAARDPPRFTASTHGDAGHRRQGHQRLKIRARGPAVLKGEGGNQVLDVPDDHRREHDQRHRRAGIGPGVASQCRGLTIKNRSVPANKKTPWYLDSIARPQSRPARRLPAGPACPQSYPDSPDATARSRTLPDEHVAINH